MILQQSTLILPTLTDPPPPLSTAVTEPPVMEGPERKVAELKGGYDLNFIDSPSDDLLCLICLNPAREPMQQTCCGKIFCCNCLQEYNKRSKPCPHCKSTTGACFNDLRSQ